MRLRPAGPLCVAMRPLCCWLRRWRAHIDGVRVLCPRKVREDHFTAVLCTQGLFHYHKGNRSRQDGDGQRGERVLPPGLRSTRDASPHVVFQPVIVLLEAVGELVIAL